jgi:hypothetical protein
LQKATFSFNMSISLSAWNNSTPTRRIFMKCFVSVFFFSQICPENSSCINIWQEYRYITRRIFRWIFLRPRNVSGKRCRENHITRFMFHNFFRKSCCLWDNVEKYYIDREATHDNIIRRMRVACWITKATDTHSEYVILIAFHGDCFANAPQCYVYPYVACLVFNH